MRILLADDHTLVRDALRGLIERQLPNASVACAACFDEALGMVQRDVDNPFDLIILDYFMPNMDGLDGLRKVKAMRPRAKVAIMSGLAGKREIHQVMGSGADGFLPKTLPGPALSSAIMLMLSGERFLPFNGVDQEVDSDMATLTTQDSQQPVTLTRREKDVLSCLLKGHSNKEIARSLDLQEVTIKLHVRSLCRKLEAKNRTQAVLRAMEAGLS